MRRGDAGRMVRSGVLAALAVSLGAREAAAQYGQPGMGPGGMGGPPPGPGAGEEKEEGPAEEAPEEEHPSELAPLTGYPSQSRRQTQVIELDGYLRLRTDFMHDFFLGQGYTGEAEATNRGKPPFPWPIECPPDRLETQGCDARNLGAANLRLRLEPTINVTDRVRVMGQIDVLDNTIMGSTPDSLVGLDREFGDRVGYAPVPSLSGTQDPPEIGQNGYLSSIRAKRAWAEVDSEIGSLRFGRMPWHFGRGIAFNSGACPDCDGGTTVDRLMALTQLYGHQAVLAYDWGSQGLTSGMVNLGRNDPQGYPLDLSQRDDVFEMMAAITKIDDPARLRDRVERGDLVVNYGLQLVYRSQDSDVAEPNPNAPTPPPGQTPTREDYRLRTVDIDVFQPDLWFKLVWRALTVEFEGTGVIGRIKDARPLVPEQQDTHLDLRQAGWVLATELHLYHDSFFLGLETGGATGDQAEDRTQYLNYRYSFVQQPVGDHTLANFDFSPEYHVDEILFRHILGTVTNAAYFKPQMAYWMDLEQSRQVGLSAAFIYSLPLVPVSTPGNDGRGYGIEMNLGLTYRNTAEGFYAGATWGVLWPLWALDRPAPLWPAGLAGSSASSAQILRTFFGVKF